MEFNIELSLVQGRSALHAVQGGGVEYTAELSIILCLALMFSPRCTR